MLIHVPIEIGARDAREDRFGQDGFAALPWPGDKNHLFLQIPEHQGKNSAIDHEEHIIDVILTPMQ